MPVGHEDDFETLYSDAEILNEYITEGRYPGDLPFESLGETGAREAIAAAEKIETFVLSKLNLLGESSGGPRMEPICSIAWKAVAPYLVIVDNQPLIILLSIVCRLLSFDTFCEVLNGTIW